MKSRRTWLACLVLAGAGCDSGKSDVQKFADAYCAEVAKCCVQAGMSGNGQLCHFAFTAGGSYNAAAGEACLAEVRAEVAAGTFCTSDRAATSACDNVVTSPGGGKQPGETCDVSSDCAKSSEGEATCTQTYNGTDWVGSCQVQIPGKAGDSPCIGTQDGDVLSYVGSGSSDVIPRGYVCNTADGLKCSSGTCVALAAVGATCSYSSDCVRTAYCDGTDHCVARVAAGATCTGSDLSECAAGTYCPTTSPRQCGAKLEIGATCGSNDMCVSANCEGSTCKPNLIDNMGWQILCS